MIEWLQKYMYYVGGKYVDTQTQKWETAEEKKIDELLEEEQLQEFEMTHMMED